jgi:hypothetical protein
MGDREKKGGDGVDRLVCEVPQEGRDPESQTCDAQEQ